MKAGNPRNTAAGKFVPAVVIGAGQAGLVMSRCLADAGIDHLILERGEVANSWRSERWDSLKLLSPNWQTRLAGFAYQGDDQDGFMSNQEFIRYLDSYARTVTAPIHTGVNVEQVSEMQSGYRVVTNRGEWHCHCLVIASGACNIPVIPRMAPAVPDSVTCLTPQKYRNPEQLGRGKVLVVGASASGLQLASEIQASGRQVIVATGEQVRMPRRYRGRDIMWWTDRSGLWDQRYDQIEDLERSRALPSSQLVGGEQPKDLDINTLQEEGIEFVGRLAGIHNDRAQFSGSLANVCKMADLKMGRLLRLIDNWAEQQDFADELPEPFTPDPIRVSEQPRLELDFRKDDVTTVIWATGFRPDYSWLQVPVLDRKGRLQHDGGVVDAPGMYAMGLPFMRRRKSQFIDGVADDARDLSAHMRNYLDRTWHNRLVSVA